MNLNSSQITSILFFLALFLGIYFGCNTKSNEQEALEKSRAQNIEIISIDRLIRENRENISSGGKSELMILEENLRLQGSDLEQLETYKSLASLWYREGQELISAYYAEQIAEQRQDEDSWSIAGTSYSIAAQRSKDDNERKHSAQKSRIAYEKALSLNPENIDHQINLALSYVDVPDQTNPMKGILMLLELNKKYPDSVPVLLQLGRLALGTNQLEKAVERLSRVVELDNSKKEAHCLLAEVYNKMGKSAEAEKARKLCN